MSGIFSQNDEDCVIKPNIVIATFEIEGIQPDMPQTLLEMAKDLTRSLVETGGLAAENMQDVLQQTHTTLRVLRDQEESGAVTALPVADSSPVDWRKSISKHVITCLECGHAMKQLSIRHLGQHGLDSRSYRMKYAIPTTQPLAARSTTDRRRQAVRQTRPWEKAPTYRNGLPHYSGDYAEYFRRIRGQ
jgi:predicted transcriptional regulator